jgi:CDP-diacylglycerol---glycerol-3-phosphate 3-phosphatidyltransferase
MEPQARLALSNLQRHYNARSGNIQEQLQREDSVVIFPVIQAGQFNIREEEECLRQLFHHLQAVDSRRTTYSFHPLLGLTTGYFGLFESYKDLILRSHIPTHIICASPQVRHSSIQHDY